MTLKRNSNLATIAVVTAGMLAGAFVAGARGGGPAQLSAAQLTGRSAAGDNECCDPSGSWDNCPGVNDTTCATAPQGQGGGCTNFGATCKSAPSGDDHAQCEGDWWGNGTCNYGANIYCSTFRTGTCRNETYDLGDMGTVILCECNTTTVSNETNDSRISCTGDECSI